MHLKNVLYVLQIAFNYSLPVVHGKLRGCYNYLFFYAKALLCHPWSTSRCSFGGKRLQSVSLPGGIRVETHWHFPVKPPWPYHHGSSDTSLSISASSALLPGFLSLVGFHRRLIASDLSERGQRQREKMKRRRAAWVTERQNVSGCVSVRGLCLENTRVHCVPSLIMSQQKVKSFLIRTHIIQRLNYFHMASWLNQREISVFGATGGQQIVPPLRRDAFQNGFEGEQPLDFTAVCSECL